MTIFEKVIRGLTNRQASLRRWDHWMAPSSAQWQLPKEVQGLIRSEKCVAFIGSGPSTGPYDSWQDLVNGLCEHCGSFSRVDDHSPPQAFLNAAQDAKDADENAYYSYLGAHFGRPANSASLLYDVLLALPFACYLTVNLDPLLALKCRTAKIQCDTTVYAYPSLDRKHTSQRSVHYLHGYVSEGSTPAPGTVVLSQGEFREAYETNSNLINFLNPALQNDPTVFIGCRLKEPVMEKVFDTCKQQQQKRLEIMATLGQAASDPPSRFILLPQPELKDSQGQINTRLSKDAAEKEEQYYRQMDITPVWYPAPGGDHSALRYALEQLAELPSPLPWYGWGGVAYVN